MHKAIALFLLSAFSIIYAMLFTGCCTTVGYITGAIIERHSSGQKEIKNWEIGSLKIDDYLSVTTKDSLNIRGYYQGLANIPRDEYKRLYLDFLKSDSSNPRFPSIGDTIDIIESSQKYRGVIFNGFGYKYQKRFYQTSQDLAGSQCYYIATVPDSNSRTLVFILEDLKSIQMKPDNTIEGKQIRSLILRGDIPLTTAAKIALQSDNQSILIDRIDKVTILRPFKWRWTGAGLGAAVDIVLLIGFMSMDNNLFSSNFTVPLF